MDKISISQAVDIFIEHRTEILKAARSQDAESGYRVLAEINNEGNWRGASVVAPDTGSLLAHKQQGYALFVDCNQFKSRTSVTEEIFDWEDQMAEKERDVSDVRNVSENHDNNYGKSHDFFDDDFLGRGR